MMPTNNGRTRSGIANIETLTVAEKRIKDLNTKLTEANRERKSAKSALAGAKKQAETNTYNCAELRTSSPLPRGR